MKRYENRTSELKRIVFKDKTVFLRQGEHIESNDSPTFVDNGIKEKEQKTSVKKKTRAKAVDSELTGDEEQNKDNGVE